MAKDKKLPLQTSNNANVAAAAPPKSAAAGSGKTIEETYQKKTQLEHILLRPDTYIGSIEQHKQHLWVYENDQMVHREISYVPGLYKIFDEILVNAADNKQRDPSMDSVKVVIDAAQGFISVYNNGNGVPVEIHQEEGVYVPEMIFGHLLTSSNYDDAEKKTTGGRNGYGAKLTNIFSTEFVVETADGRRKKKYKQVFGNNMGKKSEPVITECKESENWTKVSFKPDLAKFSMTCLEDDVVALMKKRVVDLAGTLGKSVKVELNGQRLPVKSFEDYVQLYLQTASKSRPNDLPRIYKKVNDRWEICVSLSEGQFQQVSFVNGIATIKGGTHVDYVTNQISTYIINIAKKTKDKKIKDTNFKPHIVKSHLWVFVNSKIDNPAFDSQTKETLTTRQNSFGSTCDLPESFLKEVGKSGVVESLLSWADYKQKKDMKKNDGAKKQKVTGIGKLEDANDAGGKNSDKCTLILTEGDSAKALAMAGITVVGRDHYGVFPLRGKLLNVREASHKQLLENVEIKHLKQILGLQIDKKYDSVKSLRYGHLMIMTDQDHDGSHIKGLLINFIHLYWPSLLKIPSFLVEFITPIVKATHRNGKVISFYSMPEYESWKESLGASSSGWTIKYYKGLGTSTSEEGKEYFENLDKHKKDFIWVDEQDGEAIELAFSKKKIEARKTWLKNFEPGTHLDQKEKLIKYSDFVNKELILFSMADLQRSIPSMVDGLKPGQRKILFCCFKRNFVKEAKVAQFSGYVSEHSAYHHGEASLASTIIGMAQNFVGSNNINLLQPNGQFGTRNQGGKDHANARYIFTQLSPITRYLFPKDDDILLDYLKDDGQSIEPIWYMPVIPTVLVNGSEGIGTGWSSYIPNYNPRDIVANIRHLLNGEPMEPMDPWYKGFRGTIEKSATKEGGVSYTATGIIEEVNETTLRISELPLRKWTDDYKQFLESLMTENEKTKEPPFIEDVRIHSDDTTVHFEVILSEDKMAAAKQEGLLKKFKLTTTFSTSNMHLFDSNGVIKKYDTPEQILEEFFHLRLAFYEKRKKVLIRNLELELLKYENKVRFILEVVKGEIIVSNRKRADLFVELRDKGYTPFPKKTKAAEPEVAGASNDTEVTDDNSEVVSSKDVQASDYDYLLSLSIGTLTIEKGQELRAEKDKAAAELEEMKKASPHSLWFKDLAALDRQLDEQDKRDAQAEVKRKNTKSKVMAAAGLKASKAAPKNPRKNTKKAPSVESVPDEMETSNSSTMETDNAPEVAKPKGRAAAAKKAPARMQNTKKAPSAESSPEAMETSSSSPMETDNAPEVAKPKGRAVAAKKAPARKPKAATVLKDEDDDVEVEMLSLNERLARKANATTVLNEEDDDIGVEMLSLNERLAAHNLGPSDQSEAMETEGPGRKPGNRRAAAAQKSAVLTEISDEEGDQSDDDDFEVEVVEAPAATKKGGRNPAANAKAAGKPPVATKKRGPASKQTLGQRLITQVLKPAADSNNAIGISPEKKVRKMRASPFNKKSGSVLGNDGKGVDVMSALDEDDVESPESSEVGVAARARPQRVNRGKATYVISDSESEPASEDSEPAFEDSDFEDDDE